MHQRNLRDHRNSESGDGRAMEQSGVGGGFRRLMVWQQAMSLAKECYLLTKPFPREEQFGLTSQIRRAAVSIPANIAEGSARGSAREFSRFLRIAGGSLRELETYLLMIVDLGLSTEDRVAPLMRQLESASRLLQRLQKSQNELPAEG